MKETTQSARNRSPFNQIFGTSEADSDNSGQAETATAKSTSTPEAADNESWGQAVERAAEKNRSTTTSKPAGTPERIDTVRDLLFGDQIKELKDLLHSVENHLIGRVKKMEEDTKVAIDKSERRLRDEMEAINLQLRTEKEKRGEHAAEVAKKLDTTALDLGVKVTTLGDELRRRLDEESSSIREAFTGRKDLSGLLSDLANQLGGKTKGE